jgi:hypothetical protein
METITLANGITYEIRAEYKLTGKMVEQGFYKTLLILVRPKGTKEFWAMRDINGTITLN